MATAADAISLFGSCDCGRNCYTVLLPSSPDSARETAQVRFEGSSAALQAHASPSSVFLRIPLDLIQSSTYARHPDETHAQLRRTYESQAAPGAKKFFCGGCGDLIYVWTEGGSRGGGSQDDAHATAATTENGEEKDYINVNWHTLEPQSMEILEGLGVPPSGQEEVEDPAETQENNEDEDEAEEIVVFVGGTGADLDTPAVSRMALRTTPWFENILRGSPLGRMRKRKGASTSQDGSQRVEWEIVEYLEDDGGEGERASKRLAVERGAEHMEV